MESKELFVFDQKLWEERDYWLARLVGRAERAVWPAPPPTDKPQQRELLLVLPPELQAALTRLTKGDAFLTYVAFVSAVQLCLARYAQRTLVITASPARTGAADNTLAVAAELRDTLSGRELLLTLRQALMDGYARQRFPFERLLHTLDPQEAPLFDVGVRLDGFHGAWAAGTRFLLCAELRLSAQDGLCGVLRYDESRLAKDAARRFWGHVLHLLGGLLASSNTALGKLELLTPAEHEALRAAGRGCRIPFASDRCLQQLFEEQARLTPEAPALVLADQALSYDALNTRANQLARLLQQRGVGPGARVGICLERSFELVTSVLAVLKAGGAFVPLDPSYPQKRLDFMATDAALSHLLLRSGLAARFDAAAQLLIPVDEVQLETLDGSDLPCLGQPEEAAYVIYTSGSSGQPKGVLVAHRGVCNLIEGQRRTFQITPQSRVLQFAAFSFDAFVSEVFVTLGAGATLVLPPAEKCLPGPELVELLRGQRVTAVTLPPSALAALPEAVLPELQTLVVAGEPCSAQLVSTWGPGRRFVNAYGPTEGTVCATMEICEPGDPRPAIGRPLANAQIYLLDQAQRPVPVGIPGELYIGGPGVALGYLNRPALTAERFLSDPFSDVPGARLYRTGDVASFRADGRIDYLGRADQQVKVRGYRIELGEVEAALQALPGVQEAVVLSEPGEGAVLAGFVVPRPGARLGTAALRAGLQERLPDFMVPGQLVVLEALPLTPSGKVDRRALWALRPARGAQAATHLPARTPVEARLAVMWCEILKLEQVGPKDHFFELGGHSLLVTRTVSRIREEFGVDLPLRAMFEAPTLEALARRITETREARQAQTQGALAPIRPVPRGGALAPSFAQQGMWFMEQLQPGSALYSIPIVLRLEGPLDVAALRRSFEAVLARHEALRTTFVQEAPGVLQVPQAAASVSLPLVSLAHLPEPEFEVERLLAEEMARPFDLARGPLLRTQLLALGPEVHLLQVTLHHIAADGWSLGVLLRELAALYSAYRDGREGAEAELPALSIQYADFAAWQRQRAQDEEAARELAYWQERLAGVPVLQLATDHRRPAAQTWAGAHFETTLDAELREKLEALGREHGCTLFMTLLAAFQLLLHRHTGQSDFCVGTPIANRRRQELEPLIGMFVNTLALRADVSGDPPFTQLLERVRTETLGAYAHQELPFERLLEGLRLARDASRAPLFQVVFVLQNAPMDEVALAGLHTQVVPLETHVAKHELTTEVTPQADGSLRVNWEFNTALFSEATIRRMSGHWERLLRGVVAQPLAQVSRLPLLSPEERRALLPRSLSPSLGPHRCLHQWFEAQAEKRAGATAVVYEEQSLSYAALNQRANQLARHLRQLGIGAETKVAICLERSLDLVVAIVAVLKAGGAYCPLDPSYPAERLGYMLEDARPALVICKQPQVAQLAGSGAALLLLDAQQAEIAGQSPENLPNLTRPDGLAYVIYTSGSTGKPKGSLVTHQNVVRLFQKTAPLFSFNESDVWTLFHSYAFDFSVWELWGALLYGGRLVVVPYLVSRSPEAFVHLLSAQGVTVLNQTPSAFRQLVAAEAQVEPRLPLSLREIIFGGEALVLESLAPWIERHGDARPRLVNMYGITETTVHVTYRPIQKQDLERPSSVIGQAISDLQLYVLDAHLEPQPVGVPGELYVGGAGLSRGYLNRPELTAERFLPDPHSGVPGARLYRTGDLARRLADGDIEYLGRIDQQVKIRGFRIELGEIEAALSEHPEVREAAVLVREEASGKQLVAFVVGAQAQAGLEERLRVWLLQRLPAHMVPRLLRIDTMPLTATGKLDRARLLAGAGAYASDGADAEAGAARTAEEALLVRIWSEVLGMERVGIFDNFFALGGDSIQIVQILGRAREAGLIFTLQQLFRYQTIAELVTGVPEQPGSKESTPTAPFGLLNPADRRRLLESPGGSDELEDAYPLTRLQAGMLFQSELGAGAGRYHNVTTYHLRAPWHQAALERALTRLLLRHPVLRTSFDPVRFSQPLQLVHKAVPLPLVVEDLRHLPPAACEEVLRERLAAEQRPFDAEQAPLLRFHVLLRTQDTFQLTVTEHHAILDGWSVAAALTELFQSYLLLQEDQEPPSEAPEVCFRDYVALEQEAARSQEAREFWDAQLADLPECELPRWPLPPSEPAAASVLDLPVPLPEALVAQLLQRARTLQVPLKSVLLAAHLKVLSQLTGQVEVVSGVVSHGRPEQRGGDQVLGVFLNTLPLRLRLVSGSFEALIRQVFAAEQALAAHRRYPLAEMQARRGRPLFQTAFNFTNFHVAQAVEGGGRIQVLEERALAPTELPFWADFNQAHEGLSLLLSGQADRFSAAQLRAIGQHYLQVLQSLATGPQSSHQDASVLPALERQALEAFSQERAAPRAQRFVHQEIEAVAAHAPSRTAVICGTEQLSFGALNRRANQLAHHLRRLGVGPDVTVGLCLGRSLEMVIGCLAILKAGGAYLPLDPSYPPERLAFMVQDAQARLVVTHSTFGGALASVSAPSGGSAAAVPVLCVDHQSAALLAETEQDPVSAVAGQDLAYVIYTSGSTGQPKGVMVPHEALASYCARCAELWALSSQDRVLQFAALSFDVSAEEIFTTLSRGAVLSLRSEEMLASSAEFLASVAAQGLTILDLPTSYWQELVLDLERQSLTLPPQVRLVVIGNERALPERLQAWQRCVPPSVRLLNAYGPTEATIAATVCELTADTTSVALQTGEVPIGRPLPGVKVYVLDPQLVPVPIGSPGELYIGGDSLARGYLQRPELTAARFLPDPFSPEPGARMYTTGDRARFLPDGTLEFCGRIDEQVKVRGFRIELGEIESALHALAAVRQAAVLVREGAEGTADKELVGYVVLEPGQQADVPALRTELRERLPGFMVPGYLEVVDELPRTPSGKLDRKALLGRALARKDAGYVAPRTRLELELVQLFEEVLGVRPISVRDDFFQLGGHSLLAVQLVARLQQRLGRKLPLSELLKAGSVEALAAGLQRAPTPQRPSPLVPLQTAGAGTPFFCVHPIGGSVLCYAALAQALGTERPFYALEAPALSTEQPVLPPAQSMTMATLAAGYVSAIRQVQPHGPYLLGGWSFGGILACELARQLEAAGETVALVALIDAAAPAPDPQPQPPADAAELFAGFVSDLLSDRAQQQEAQLEALLPAWQATRHLPEPRWFELLCDHLRDHDLGVLPLAAGPQLLATYFQVFRQNVEALAGYPLPILDAPRALFLATEGAGAAANLSAWQATPGALQVIPLPADHYSILSTARVADLAVQLSAQLHAALPVDSSAASPAAIPVPSR